MNPGFKRNDNLMCLRYTVKLLRAYGGCLGIKRRRRTWAAAKSPGKPLTGIDPGISESANRLGLSQVPAAEYIGSKE